MAGDRQVDCSLPSTRPVGEYLIELPAWLNLPASSPPIRWALSTPKLGPIDNARSLDEVGVVDGDILYLSREHEAAEPPIVDDVLKAVTDAVDTGMNPWKGVHRDWVVTIFLAMLSLGFTTIVAVANVPLSVVLLAVTFVVSVAAANILRARGGVVLGWAGFVAGPAAAFVATADSDRAFQLPVTTAAALVGVTVVGFAVHRSHDLVIFGSLGAALSGVVAAVVDSGADNRAVAAWSSILIVLVMGMLPRLALMKSGLVALVRRQEEAGDAVPRADLARSLRIGRSWVTGLLAVTSVAGVSAAATLVATGQTAQVGLGALLGAIFLLRSRSFSDVTHVGLVLAVPVAGLIAGVVALPSWLELNDETSQLLGWTIGLVVAISAIIVGYVRLPDVTAAHVSGYLDWIDRLAVLALIPVVLLAQDVFAVLVD